MALKMLTVAISILKTTTQYNNSSSSSDKLYNISDDRKMLLKKVAYKEQVEILRNKELKIWKEI